MEKSNESLKTDACDLFDSFTKFEKLFGFELGRFSTKNAVDLKNSDKLVFAANRQGEFVKKMDLLIMLLQTKKENMLVDIGTSIAFLNAEGIIVVDKQKEKEQC